MKISGMIVYRMAVLFSAVVLCANANAQDPTNWGTWATTGTINCISADCSGGGVSGPPAALGPEDDQVEATPASSSIINPLGNASTTTDFVSAGPGLNVFLITGNGTSVAGGASRAQGAALALYRYDGAPTTITVTASVGGTFTGPLSGQNSNLDGIIGRVRIFTDPNDIASIDSFEEGARLFCLFECYSPDEQLLVEINTGVSILTDSVDISLNDGDIFYLQGTGFIGAAGGGEAATTTGITVSFSSAAGLTSVLPGSGDPDADGDGVADASDNCTNVSNPFQEDADSDGFGNICDADFNDDCFINFADLAIMQAGFFTIDALLDLDSSGGPVNFGDLGIMQGLLFLPPGPSASGSCL